MPLKTDSTVIKRLIQRQLLISCTVPGDERAGLYMGRQVSSGSRRGPCPTPLKLVKKEMVIAAPPADKFLDPLLKVAVNFELALT